MTFKSKTVVLMLGLLTSAVPALDGAKLIEESSVKGGLIVRIGCEDGTGIADLRAGERYIVHGLDTDPQRVKAARRHLLAKGLTRSVSVSLFDGTRLPFVDGIVRLVVAEDPGAVSREEIMRVLSPRGTAMIAGNKTVKPWPDDIGQWTHYLQDATNNAVAQDKRIAPPRHLQWQGGPKWSRHHDHMASMSAMVSGNGRLYYIMDEGSKVSPQLPADWKIVGRDAFSGVILWKRPIDRWHTHLWPLKSGPASLPRRLVAGGDTVYATLGIEAPVTALDGATGKTVRTYEGSEKTEEILLSGNTLLVLVNRTPVDYAKDLETDTEKGKSRDRRTTYSPQMKKIWAGIRSARWSNGDRSIIAFDAERGTKRWEKATKVIPLTLGTDGKAVYFHDGDVVVSLDIESGSERWESPPVPVWKGLDGRGTQSWFAPTLVVSGDRVYFAGGEKTHMSYMGWGSKDIGQDTMTAFSAETGKKLWTADHPYAGYNSPEDLFVIDDKVWVGKTAKGGDGYYAGHDPASGKRVKDYPPTVKTSWFHHRCYRAKATDRYILCSRNGTEFVDIKTGTWTIHHWVRGGCLYGVMPANGFLYAPPHPCACFPEAKLFGFTALAPASNTRAVPEKIGAEGRLEKGPAYGKIEAPAEESSDSWPTFRYDPARGSASGAKVPAKLKRGWEIRIGGKLTQPVTGGGMLFVSNIDNRTIHAVDEQTGKKKWSLVVDGRVDTPPTYDRGRLLFGSTDGFVYCLRASDGETSWRFRAAPIDRRIVAYNQVESAWPLHGSVLVQKGVATVVAGRSMFLDGGLRVCRLDVDTGELIGEKVLDDRDPNSPDQPLQKHIKGLNMPVALPDILSSDGERLYMRSQAMDLEGKRLKLGPGGSGYKHLFAPYGFTDDSYFHRVYWLYNDSFSGGIGGFGNGKSSPSGRILVNDGQTVLGYGRKPNFYRWSSVIDYHLFARGITGGGSHTPAPAGRSGFVFKKSPSLNPRGTPLTIAAWVKPKAKDGTILVRGAQAIGFALILTDGKPRMLVRVKGKTHDVVADKPIGSDWTHVAGVLDADKTMQVFINGEPAGTAKGVPTLTGDPLIVMKVGYDDTHQLLPDPLPGFNGAMDEVMLFHRALSADEIRAVSKGGAKLDASQKKDLVLYLDFKDGKARDRSSCKNNGRGGTFKTVEGPFGDAIVLENEVAKAGGKKKGGRAARNKRRDRNTSSGSFTWSVDIPLMVRAMALADRVLFIAGPPDLLDEVDAFQNYADKQTQSTLVEQDKALAGKSGAALRAVDAETGQTLAAYELESPPVFDGLIVTGRGVFISTMDGRVVSFVAE